MLVARSRYPRRWLSGLLAVIATSVALAGCGRSIDITAKPGEAADPQVAESDSTAVNIAAVADLAHAEDEIAKLLPDEIAVVNRRLPHAFCQSAGTKQVCVDARLYGRIVRDGQMAFAGTARGLELKIPLRYELQVQPLGAGASSPLAGALAVTASYSVSLDDHWQPSLKLDPVFRWDSGDKIKVLAADTALQGDVEPTLALRLQKVPPTAIAELLPPELRQQAEIAWRYLHYPMALSEERQIWLRGTPLGLHFAGFASHGSVTEARVAITARLQTFISERPAPLPPSPMPAPGSGPEAAHGGILLPAEVPYEVLTEAASHHLPVVPPREVAGEAPMSPPTIKSISYYPAGRRLAIAVQFGSLAGDAWLSPRGVAYFTAAPVIKAGTSELVLSQTELFTAGAKLTPLRKDMPILLDTRFAENVGAAVSIDVSDKLAAAQQQVKQLGSIPLTQGLRLYMAADGARVVRIAPGIGGLRLQVVVSGDFTLRREGTDVAAGTAQAAEATP